MTIFGTTGPSDPVVGDHVVTPLPTAFVCDGCGFRAPDDAPVPMRCPEAVPDDDIDHVLVRTLDPERLAFPKGTEPNPYVRYRALTHGAHVASALGWRDADVVAMVDRLDKAVARVDGHGFVVTPLLAADRAALALGLEGELLVKDETRNVAGSHKARHLMGTALELDVAEALERSHLDHRVPDPPARSAPLAIASCGNAALAAAVIARAWGRELLVFVPTDADHIVVDRLRRLEAIVTVAERTAGVPGDPTYHLLRGAIDDGAIPFTCQGNENGLAIEGGETLGYELVTDLIATGRRLDRLVIQVGGGALASSCTRAFDDAHALGAIDRLPRIHAVQSPGAAPLVRAYDLVADRLSRRLGLGPIAGTAGSRSLHERAAAAERLRGAVAEPAAVDELSWIVRHRSTVMWPWEAVPQSVAGGILDDETYDWFAIVGSMLRTGGYPVTASEKTLLEANRLGRATTGIDVDHTGSAGLAGLMALRRAGLVDAAETVAVLFTGVRRDPSPTPTAHSRPAQGEPR